MPRLEGIGSATAGLRLQPERDDTYTVRSGDTLNASFKTSTFSKESISAVILVALYANKAAAPPIRMISALRSRFASIALSSCSISRFVYRFTRPVSLFQTNAS